MAITIFQNLISQKLSGAAETVEWATATDWDNAKSQNSVRHTTNDGDSIVKMGKEPGADGVTEDQYHIYHNGSGTTVKDVASDKDSQIQAETAGNEPTWDNSPPSRFLNALDGSNAGADGYWERGPNNTVVWDSSENFYEFDIWFYPTTTGWQVLQTQNGVAAIHFDRGGNQKINIGTFGDNAYFGPSGGLALNKWHHVYGYWDVGTEIGTTIDGTDYGPKSTTDGTVDRTDRNMLHATGANFDSGGDVTQVNNALQGKIAESRTASGSSKQLKNNSLYITSASLTTATKSFSSAVKPNISDLVYTLNSQSINIDIIGSPAGTSETKNVTLSGQSSETLSWNNSHQNFEIVINLSNSNAAKSPKFEKIVLKSN